MMMTTTTTTVRPGGWCPLANGTLMARKAGTGVKQQGPGSGTMVLTWAIVLQRVTRIELALSAWEAPVALWPASSVYDCDQDI